MNPKRVLVVIDLVQDFDVLAPVILALQASPGFEPLVQVSLWLTARSPRIVRRLDALGVHVSYIDRPALLAGRGPSLQGFDALLTASESTAGPHRWVHALTRRANRHGLATFTLQHGIDNLEVMSGPAGLDLASDVFFCWPPADGLPEGLPPAIRQRVVPVGRPRLPAPSRPPEAPPFDVGVFDNLHAAIYTDEDRRQVLEGIHALARARPNLRLHVRTHPAGGWMDQHAAGFAPLKNINYVPSDQARAESEAGQEAPAVVARVITTPSTIALDAVQAGRPVALALDGGGLYAPLRRLSGPADWIAFADAPPRPSSAESEFLDRHVAPGDATRLILEHMTTFRGKLVHSSAAGDMGGRKYKSRFRPGRRLGFS